MAVPGTDDTQIPPSAAPPVRPSWETAPRPAAPPRQGPRPAAPRSPELPPVSPYYAAPAPAAYVPPPAAPAPAAFMPQSDLDVRYDLAGNPIASSPAAAPVPTQFGYSAGAPAAAAGVWPPPVGGAAHSEAQVYRNTSGEQGHLPPEIERLRWHWGAFFFPTFWSRRHGLRALAFIIVVSFALLRALRLAVPGAGPAIFFGVYFFYLAVHLGVQIYFGLNGHRIGWRNRHFPGGVDEYFKVQNAWMWWGFAISAIGMIFTIFTIVSMSLAGSALTLPYHNHPQSNGDGTSSYNSSYSNGQ